MLITIIIPTHNRATLLPRAIRSVLAQDDPNWELVVVDDGSTDDTRAVVEGFADARIRYIYQENRQLNGARNTGIREARGEYAGFLDDDDELLPDHPSRLRYSIEKDGARHDIYRSGELLRRGERETEGYNYRNDEPLLVQFWEHPTGMFGMLIRTQLLRDNPFNEDHLLLDDFLWLNQILRTASLRQIDAHTAVVHLHPEQRSAHYLTDELLEQNISRLVEAYNLPGVSEQVPFSAYQQQVFHQYVHYSRQLGRRGKALGAMKMWRKALSYATAGDAVELAKTLATGVGLWRR